MKKIKLFSIVAAFVAAFAFTSCNTGDDNNSNYQPLTKAEKDLCYLKTAGVHYGKLAYMSDEHVTEIKGTKEYIDTLDVTTDIWKWQRHCNDCSQLPCKDSRTLHS